MSYVGHHIGGIVLAAFWVLGLTALFFSHQISKWRIGRRAKASVPVAVFVPPEPRCQPRPLNRAERLAHLDAIWLHTNQGFINQHIGLRELDVADLQPLADGLLDEEASR